MDWRDTGTVVEPALVEVVLLVKNQPLAAAVLLLCPCHLEQFQLAAGPGFLQQKYSYRKLASR